LRERDDEPAHAWRLHRAARVIRRGEALRLIGQEKCSLFYGTPNMAQAIHEHSDRAKHDLTSLRGGMSMVRRSRSCVSLSSGKGYLQHLCMSETYGNSHVSDASEDLAKRLSSVGNHYPALSRKSLRLKQPGAAARVVGEIRIKG